MSLLNLDLSDNKLKQITAITFRGIKSLRSLNIGNNSLGSITSAIFQNLKILQKLILGSSKLQIFAFDIVRANAEFNSSQVCLGVFDDWKFPYDKSFCTLKNATKQGLIQFCDTSKWSSKCKGGELHWDEISFEELGCYDKRLWYIFDTSIPLGKNIKDIQMS